MKQAGRFAALLITWIICLNACSQTGSTKEDISSDHYTGSTPCDALIKAVLNIPPGDSCEFLKWEMFLSKGRMDTGSFQFAVLYGESQPNTNGFKGGGKKLEVKGKYSISRSNLSDSGRKIYHLTGTKIYQELSLIEMDNNIFHFANAKGNYLPGNAGYSYVLNRMKE